MVNVAVVKPAGTMADSGTVSAALLLVSRTTTGVAGNAALSSRRVATEESPPSKDPSTCSKSIMGAAGGLTTSVAVRVSTPAAALMVTVVSAVTGCVAIENDVDALPAAIVIVAGTVTIGALLAMFTTYPVLAAAAVSATSACAESPPVTLGGVMVS